ncbi:MAG: hypothetical protein ACREIS_10015 [Nitrospiraceae bacterium]
MDCEIKPDIASLKGRTRSRRRWRMVRLAGGLVLGALLVLSRLVSQAEAPESKSPRMTCGTCPSGYATTGVTSEPTICKEGDPTLVQCQPLGANLMAVCGSCPEGYAQIGSSNVPARCGNAEGGLMTQCQLQKLETTLPDPTQGGLRCPPNCAGQMPTPGQGAIPPPPKFLPPPKEQKSE